MHHTILGRLVILILQIHWPVLPVIRSPLRSLQISSTTASAANNCRAAWQRLSTFRYQKCCFAAKVSCLHCDPGFWLQGPIQQNSTHGPWVFLKTRASGGPVQDPAFRMPMHFTVTDCATASLRVL